MYLEHPEEERAYSNAQQYYFGDAFLVSPIVSAGKGPGKIATQAVWFPEGRWYHWFSGEQYEGDVETVVTADIMEFPLFVKGGFRSRCNRTRRGCRPSRSGAWSSAATRVRTASQCCTRTTA